MHILVRSVTVLALTLAIGLGATAPVSAKSDADPLAPEQLEQLAAPIALYPDALVAQILMAATYPLDVVQASRWTEDHEDLKGEALDKAVKEEPWDESVKALVFFPSVLAFMSDNLDWTQDLGDAVLSQQGELTDTIQRLRREADKAGALATTEQQRVEKSGDTIVIQPAQPEVVYVPAYDPVKVYGASEPPAKTYYPDAYADAASGYAAGTTTSYLPGGEVVPSQTVVYPAATETSAVDDDYDGLIGFGIGALAGGLLTAAIMWDDDDDWNDRLYYGGGGNYGGAGYWGQPNYWSNNGWREPANVNIDRSRTIERNVERGDIAINKGIVGNEVKKWEHNPERRGGVRYRDSSTEKRFAEVRKDKDRLVNRDEARGRARTEDRQLKAPDMSKVRSEAAASGKLAELGGDRGAGAGQGAALKDRAGDGAARERVQAKAPERAQSRPADRTKPAAKPKVQPKAAAKRPVDRAAKRPAPAEVKRAGTAKATRPASAGGGAKVQRPASRPSAGGGGAFKSGRPQMDRAASHRGGASRAAASRPHGGGGRGGAARGGGGRGRG